MSGGERKCELCGVPARARCESDEADLCWECDAEVHGANFLVARHSRRLLCRNCHRPTPWRADGPRLGLSVSFCLACGGCAAAASTSHGSGGAAKDPDDGDYQVVPSPPAPSAGESTRERGNTQNKDERGGPNCRRHRRRS